MLIVDSLKTASELVEKASDSLDELTKQAFLPSQSARDAVLAELARIRLHLSMLSRNATILHAVATRRKPPLQKEREDVNRR